MTNSREFMTIFTEVGLHTKCDIQFSPSLLDIDAVSEIVQAVIKDHPEIFWVNYYRYTISHSSFKCWIAFLNSTMTVVSNSCPSEASSWKKRIVSQLPKHFSNKDKAWVLFDYLARQVTYGKNKLMHTVRLLSGR